MSLFLQCQAGWRRMLPLRRCFDSCFSTRVPNVNRLRPFLVEIGVNMLSGIKVYHGEGHDREAGTTFNPSDLKWAGPET